MAAFNSLVMTSKPELFAAIRGTNFGLVRTRGGRLLPGAPAAVDKAIQRLEKKVNTLRLCLEVSDCDRSRTAFAALAVILGLLIHVGCTSRSAYQVSGRVQYKDGSPITGGSRVIHLEPAANTTAQIRKMATGEITSDGSFTMYTRKPGDGVIPGIYVITFSVLDKPMGGKSLIPAKYSSAADSPLSITVDGNKTELLYELEKREQN
jgi:hypothetical protein